MAAGRCRKVRVRVRRLGESAAGLSELEKLGGLLPIQYRRSPRRTAPQVARTATLLSGVTGVLCRERANRRVLTLSYIPNAGAIWGSGLVLPLCSSVKRPGDTPAHKTEFKLRCKSCAIVRVLVCDFSLFLRGRWIHLDQVLKMRITFPFLKMNTERAKREKEKHSHRNTTGIHAQCWPADSFMRYRNWRACQKKASRARNNNDSTLLRGERNLRRGHGPNKTLEIIYPTLEIFYPTLEIIYPTLKIFYPTLEIFYPTLEIIYPTLEIFYPTLEISYPTLEIIYPTLKIFYPTLEIFYPTLEIIYPILEIFYPTLKIFYPTLEIFYPTLEIIYPILEIFYPTLEIFCPTLEISYPTLPPLLAQTHRCGCFMVFSGEAKADLFHSNHCSLRAGLQIL